MKLLSVTSLFLLLMAYNLSANEPSEKPTGITNYFASK